MLGGENGVRTPISDEVQGQSRELVCCGLVVGLILVASLPAGESVSSKRGPCAV